MQSTVAALTEHLGVLQPMLEAAPDAAPLLMGALSRSQLLQGDTMAKVAADFEMGTRKGKAINGTVLRRNLESVLQYLDCTVMTGVEQLSTLLSLLQDEQRAMLHFSRSNCDTTWLAQVPSDAAAASLS